ncbi:MAG TPA: hypothetical protein VHU23_06115 [Rhizomicrobium sp.]|jgi:hypothetical protein|nr:hypothetical protein [Rhizomicrobium sp.]
MNAKAPPEDDAYSDAETVRRREDALKRMMSTPPERHAHLKAKRATKAVKKGRPAKAFSALAEAATVLVN